VNVLAIYKARQAHKKRLIKAAGVATVDLVCADDTWDFIHRICTREYGTAMFKEGAAVRREDGLAEISFSGPALVKLLIRTEWVRRTHLSSDPDWALSTRIYDAAAEVVDRVDLNTDKGEQLPPIVIDARVDGN